MDVPYQYDINITTGTNGYINMRFDGELRINNSGTSSWGLIKLIQMVIL